jgi:TonB family protein
MLCLGALGCAASRVSSRPIQDLRSVPTSCASAGSSDSTIYDTTQISERPVARSAPKPEYPGEARSHRIQGRAVVTAVVSREGEVEPASVTIRRSAQALLDAEARRVVTLATFWPACRDGAAVRARIAIPFDFTLSRDPAAMGFAVIAGLWAGVMAVMMH